jgi:hypothetical protein
MELESCLSRGKPMDDRSKFLIEMYNQMFSDINRHITVVWQSVGVVIGAFAIFALVEKSVISLDQATAIIVLLCAWLFGHMLDAGYWYNRNLVIISNIEKQFLRASDQHDIQYYFGMHRSKSNRMITHLRLQTALGGGILGLVILFHFSQRVWPTLSMSNEIEITKWLPYAVLAVSMIFCVLLARDRTRSYVNFVMNSPGVSVDNSGIVYGAGHTVDEPGKPKRGWLGWPWFE